MHRLLIALLLLLPALAPAAAEEYRDDEARYRVTIPPNWTNGDMPDVKGKVWVSPRAEQTLGFCLLTGEAAPETSSMTQAEIDQRLAGSVDDAFWRETFEEMTDLKVEKVGEDVQNGHRTYYAIMNYADEGERIKFKTVLHAVPGHIHTLYCAAFLAAYPREETDFETFFTSFTPFGSELVVTLPPYARHVVYPAQIFVRAGEAFRDGARGLKITAKQKKRRR